MPALIVSNKGKKLEELTTLRAEEESQRRMNEEMEMIEAMGQRSDLKAKADVKRYFNQMEAEEKAFQDEAYEILLGLRKDVLQYNHFLTACFQRFASQEDLPKKIKLNIKATKKGIVVSIVGTKYYGAFASCGMPPYDYYAAKILAVKVGNTVAKMLGYTRQTENGILIPDKEDLEQFKHG